MSGNAYDMPQGEYSNFGGQGGGYGGQGYGGQGQGYQGGQGGYQGGPAKQQKAESLVKSNQSDGSIINSRESPNNTKMFVGGLARTTTTNSMRAYFETFGTVRDVEIKADPQTGQSRGFGFVLFLDEEGVNAVCCKADHFLDGKRIDPKRAEKRNAKIFVGGLKPDHSNEEIQEVFGQHGEIEIFERRMDKNKGGMQAFCFITFKDDQVAQNLCKQRWVDVGDKRCEIKTAVENKMKLQGGPGGPGGRGGYGGPDFGGYGGHSFGGPPQRGGYGGGMAPQQSAYPGASWGAGLGPNGGQNQYGGYGRGGYGGAPIRGGGPMRGGPRGGARGRPSPY